MGAKVNFLKTFDQCCFNQSIDLASQSINQSINQSVNQSIVHLIMQVKYNKDCCRADIDLQ